MLASLWYSSYHHMPAVYYTHLSLCCCYGKAHCECQHNSSVKTDEWHGVHRNAYKCRVLTDKLFARLLRINTAVHRTSSLITLIARAHGEVKRSQECQSSFDLPDLNLLRISMECSEPRRVIMLTVQFQCSKVAK